MRIETERLVLRRPRLGDAAELWRFLGDAEAMRYTRKLADLRDCRRYLAGHECLRRRLGFGLWTVLAKEDGAIIGIGGLSDDPFDPGWGVEVTYHFAPAVWGKGYATELTRFSLKTARDELGLAEVRAFAHPENAASQRVLAKAGFERQRFVPAMNRYLYARRLSELP